MTLPGRRSQAARNDEVILAAARDVFLADPKAPVAAVAERARVGISALYRRYPGKDDLLRTLCRDGLTRYVEIAEAAAEDPDGWAGLVAFLGGVVDADVHALTVNLAGTFTPTPEMRQLAVHASEVTGTLVARAHATGRLRADVVTEDIALLLEGCSAIRLPDPGRTAELRRRYLALLVDGLSTAGGPLPGPPPVRGEWGHRWTSGTR